MSLAFTVGFVAYGTRAMNAAILQVPKDLEEAAYVSGAARWRTVWRIFYPLMLHAVRQAGQPLMLYEGEENEVLAILIWNMWDEGKVERVGALGVMLTLGLLLVTVLVRILGFGRGAHSQTESR